MTRQRLDRALVERGLVNSRQEAVSAIEDGRVLVGGASATKPARQVSPQEPIVLVGDPPRYVSRGGLKLEGALETFAVDVRDRVAVDAGSATGGFTDCLLQGGAQFVVAVDVGNGQLHERLRSDERVLSLERTNIRDLTREGLGEAIPSGVLPDLLTADLSFTSLRPLLPVLLDLVGPRGELVLLCKPQFEVGREVAAKGKGVVRSRNDRELALRDVIRSLEEAGAAIMGVVNSPILGPAGNAEFLLHVRREGTSTDALDHMVEAALDAAELLG